MTRTVEAAADITGLEDAFIKVSFEEEPSASKSEDKLYGQWVEQCSAKHSGPEIYGADALRKLYPKHSLVMTADYNVNLLGFPGAYTQPLSPSELITNVMYIPLARKLGGIPGVLADSIEFGSFTVAWDKYEFTVYIAKWPVGFSIRNQHFILHEGSEEPSRDLLVAAGSWNQELHDEIFVFNQGFWRKDHGLWLEVQKADWKDVILKEEFKESLQKDITSFFKSEELYKQLAIPWKRGLIMYGPPGNGKTISIKAIMKSIQAEGHIPLYVKSFQSYQGEEGSMAAVFEKARQVAPCVIVLEDLDSLINDRNRSFFLNQLDGLEGNDGLLVIGTTNHFERLDPGLSTRPSRFDRKYIFDDPDREERALYAHYWQNKLAGNDAVDFPDSLVAEVAELTYDFSFAYLKEAFVSTLVLLIGDKETKNDFEKILKNQIKTLRKQLDKTPSTDGSSHNTVPVASMPAPISLTKPGRWVSTRHTALTAAAASLGRSFVY